MDVLNMWRREINKYIDRFVCIVGFICEIIQGCKVNKTQNCLQVVQFHHWLQNLSCIAR